MRQLLHVVCALALVPLLGCSDGEPIAPPPVQEVTGFWTGTVTLVNRDPQAIRTGTTGQTEVELVLTEDASGRVTGAGALFTRQTVAGPGFGLGGTAQGASRAFEVDGTNAFPTIVFTLGSGTSEPNTELIYLRGEFTGVDQVEGRLVGGGFNEDRIRLRRVERLPARP